MRTNAKKFDATEFEEQRRLRALIAQATELLAKYDPEAAGELLDKLYPPAVRKLANNLARHMRPMIEKSHKE